MREREPGYGSDVLRVGLTGTLGAGKSTVGKALAARGAIVIDADQVARDITAQGSPGERAVLEHFGDRARADVAEWRSRSISSFIELSFWI